MDCRGADGCELKERPCGALCTAVFHMASCQSSDEKVEAVQFFECNICLETACNPVITQCGHLYWCVQNPESASHFQAVWHRSRR